jgi:hypothetical protein
MRLASRPRGIPKVSQAERDRQWRARFAQCMALIDSHPSEQAIADAERECCRPSLQRKQQELDLGASD